MKINWLALIKDWFGLIGVVLLAVSAVGFSISTPWPAKADVEAVQKTIEDTQKQLQLQGCLILRVLLKGYQEDLEHANQELEENPRSASAQRAKIESETQIAELSVSMRKQGCY